MPINDAPHTTTFFPAAISAMAFASSGVRSTNMFFRSVHPGMLGRVRGRPPEKQICKAGQLKTLLLFHNCLSSDGTVTVRKII